MFVCDSKNKLVGLSTYFSWYEQDTKLNEFKEFLKKFTVENIIDYVHYFRIYSDNSCFMSTSHPQWVTVFIEHFEDIDSTFLSNKLHNSLKSETTTYGLWYHNKYDKLQDFNTNYGIFNGFDIYIRHFSYVEVLSVNGNVGCHYFHDYCFSNLKYLHDSIAQIRKRLSDIKYYRCFAPIKIYHHKDLNIAIANQNKVFFTTKELDCINYYIKGHSAKFIGKILGISHRTVEVHIKNIKQKLGVNYKNELINKVEELGNLLLSNS